MSIYKSTSGLIDLTILIPTWDRPEQINQRLREINDLWQGDAKVKIQVNPGRYSAADVDTSLYKGPLEISQNRQNIGLFANVVCGLHGINTKWLWILGDDDSLHPEARRRIERAIELSESQDFEAVLFNQWNHSEHHPRTLCKDFKTFANATGFGNPLFISASLWRTAFFQSRLGLFVEYSFSAASHVLIYIATLLEKSGNVLVIEEPLINYVYSHRWNRIAYLHRVFFLFRHPSVWTHRQDVMSFVWPQARWALQSAAHEQVKSGDATLLEWIKAGLEVTRQQFFCASLPTAIARTREIWSVLFEIYSLPQLAQTIVHRLRRNLTGHQKKQAPTPQKGLGL